MFSIAAKCLEVGQCHGSGCCVSERSEGGGGMDGDGEATEGVPLDDRLRLQGSQPSGGKQRLHRGMDQ
jgi:hypothetical protein